MAAALNQQQQLKNEATKMAMRVPLFYGNEKEDTMNIKDFLTRFESACNAMGLNNDAEKCNLFGSYLRGRASAMWMNAKFQGIETDTWRNVKDHFMIRYRGKTETTTFCHQIPRLVQDKTETVSDFAERCITEMREFAEAMPTPPDTYFRAAYLALAAAEITYAREGERRMMIECLATGCFLMGVVPSIRTPLMQAHPTNLSEAIREAMNLELVEKTNNSAKNRIANLAELDDEDLAEIEDLDEDTIKAINMKRSKFGRQPFRRPRQFAGSQGKGGKGKSYGDKSGYKCRFCNKEGHMQEKCYSRISKNAPCVDRYGKPLTGAASGQTKLASVEDDEDARLDPGLLRHLNGFVKAVQGQEDKEDLNSA